MANLDLIPKLPVLAVQAGLFMTNLALMKKLFMEPYLKVKDFGDRQTVGSQGDATRNSEEADRLAETINARLQAAMDEARSCREQIRSSAMAERQSIVTAAQGEARVTLEKVESEIKNQMGQERLKVPNIVATLVDEVYKVALS